MLHLFFLDNNENVFGNRVMSQFSTSSRWQERVETLAGHQNGWGLTMAQCADPRRDLTLTRSRIFALLKNRIEIELL
jgi:hypothetical protein